jgi:Fuc2NAc and GlcNAc transferase
VVSGALTYVALHYARTREMIDRPNERSSHSQPVPRGGGIALAATFFVSVIVLWSIRIMAAQLAIALLGGGLLVAWIGWLDDRGGVAASKRALVHLIAAVWAIAWLGGFDRSWLISPVELGPLGTALAVVGIIWWINLYNFMDGIDGIAAGQAVTVAAFAAGLLLIGGGDQIAFPTLALAGCSLGFLFWNWPPARIFMGDVGSGFLGFTFAVLAIASDKSNALPLIYWLVLSGVFVFDATVTLVRRIIRREPFWNAHRSHAYQRVVPLVKGHRTVTLGVLAINLTLAMLVYIAQTDEKWLRPGLFLALVILLLAYICIERFAPMAPAPSKLSKTTLD